MKHDFPDKIIFLDIDGVINTTKYHFTKFDEECMDNLLEIINKTNAKIVVSSSWRDEDNIRMKNNFLEHGFYESLWNKIIDITCRGYRYTIKGSNFPIVRGNEIKQWIDIHLKYPWHSNKDFDCFYRINNEDGSFKIMDSNKLNVDYSYLILDDDNDMLYEQRNNFIQTDSLLGLSKEDITKAIKILNYDTKN